MRKIPNVPLSLLRKVFKPPSSFLLPLPPLSPSPSPSLPAPQIGSPFNLRQPYNLLALLQQEERVTSLEILREELLNFRDQFDGFGDFDSFEESFFALDPECRNVQSITTFDLYISTVLPLEHKQIRCVVHIYTCAYSYMYNIIHTVYVCISTWT